MNKAEIRAKMLELAAQYAQCLEAEKQPKKYIPASGKNIGAEELANMIEASLDMWLTAGRFNDEFENYLKKQQIKTTFNGSELESFSWYRKALGLA